MKLTRKSLIVEEDYNDSENIEVWSTNLDDDEIRRPTHGACYAANMEEKASSRRCFMVQIVSSRSQGYFTDDGVSLDMSMSSKTVSEHVEVSKKVINKVQLMSLSKV